MQREWVNKSQSANGAEQASPHPSLDQVKHALLLQQPPRKKNMRSLFEIITITAQFLRPPSRPSFAELVQKPEFLLHPEKFPPRQMKFSYPPSSKPLQGAFKIAHFGHTDIPLFGNSTRVCTKQTFSTSENSKKPVIYQSQVQAANLSVELNCLGWASALMDLVYKFMEKEVTVRGLPAFEVPQMRYVQAGLAISNDAEGRQNAYLLEEFIDSEAPGWFVKYLNNNSAKPYRFKDEERSIRAEFLSFAQHVQFIETGGRALLTDPQIITNP
ncbi:uncharacterized protein LACBIDRAFT_332540 [Laccaria bicolor S238N-H82]|uniref:Predicted protein n=1 Tax=Laccaria bicolor (strain S238N-H82 / ATCC MYA-4686) TaxID=486041 RepID=B0DT29_LACBS|nr:uncharacterized protein LACBIDRAFT_332540 [Laccaria bicolor S238N-H82]EDR02151.1 predicted protein [Laccaria bicolor S238N-H82]|eukprot:XP_001887096.1 predicted protein [Laccaria bicolor S238N-H82]